MLVPPESLSLGPLSIRLYSVGYLIGIAAGYYLAKPEAVRRTISAELLQVSILYGVLPGLIGARLYHVVDQWAYYAARPAEILMVWQGGLGILGGLAGGVLGLSWFARRYRRPLLDLLDVWAPSVLLAQAIGRFGNWTNQEAFGPPTDAPWGIFIDPAHRPEQYATAVSFHPTFFYEAGLNLIGVAMLLALRGRLRAKPGAVLGAYLVIYGIGRFIVEFYRFDTAQLFGVAAAQVFVVPAAALGVWLVLRPTRGRGKSPRSG